jgi:hypothetical protein
VVACAEGGTVAGVDDRRQRWDRILRAHGDGVWDRPAGRASDRWSWVDGPTIRSLEIALADEARAGEGVVLFGGPTSKWWHFPNGTTFELERSYSERAAGLAALAVHTQAGCGFCPQGNGRAVTLWAELLGATADPDEPASWPALNRLGDPAELAHLGSLLGMHYRHGAGSSGRGVLLEQQLCYLGHVDGLRVLARRLA